ncbi:hypothetical protein [Yoonia sediminilitoris]|uniref:Lipoprotein n=1 Tax=Yoonia sediminilitoris TaxID=1286148 RepID=A0A2T6KR87_9RHOB|nr:hypothetical protein [Yoonia sediminilitoris]PUB19078.1 hypothetical protein C8N45_101669 [Yoonia sediminilitoris]RCW99246.1 hypothetical protein DFP92_101669 [Yoonia sediminilitoris]
MMRKLMIVGAALAVTACSTGPQPARPFDDPAVQKLYNMPTPEYYATLKIATMVAQNCARYSYDSALDLMVNEKRNEVGRGSLSALSLRNAIDLETEVSQRSFAAKHGVELTGADLCMAADAESLENSAIAAVLVPVG